MPTPVLLFGDTRDIPITDETAWGDEVSGVLIDLCLAAEATISKQGGSYFPKETSASNTLASGATLTPSAAVHLIQGSGGPVILHATNAIADGASDGQKLVLIGAHAVNSVTIPHDSNCALNGPAVLFLGESIQLRWNLALSVWQEIGSRSH